jgi:TrmH family RNA methyltransferase
VLIVGSEAYGVSHDLMERATQKITIPLENECESLNAAIAGSICMFEMTRQNSRV